MLAGFRGRVLGKTLINVFHRDIAEIRFVGKLWDHTDIFINQRIQCYFINTTNLCPLKAKFHYTGPTGPDRTRTDFFARRGPQTRVSDKVRGLCLVGSGRARVVEFSYNCTQYVMLYPQNGDRIVTTLHIAVNMHDESRKQQTTILFIPSPVQIVFREFIFYHHS